jgi:SAM-dependent methyltransferase
MTADFDAAFWDRRYSESTSVWSGNPNPHLVSDASALAPGRALDIGSGEGADAMWLARRGWSVTAVDISSVALARAAGIAAADPGSAARISWAQHDVTAWTPEEGAFELVSAQFMHLPPEPRERLFRGLAAAVAPGGTLLIVAHHPSDLDTSIQRPRVPELFYTAEQLVATLDGAEWEIVAADARPRPVADAAGEAVTAHDTVLNARRRDAAD